MQNCTLTFKKAVDNSKARLVKVGALRSMQSNEIADVAIFQAEIKRLEQIAIDTYGVSGKQWLMDDNWINALPNHRVLNAIDMARKDMGLYEDRISAKMLKEITPVTEGPRVAVDPTLRERLFNGQDTLDTLTVVKNIPEGHPLKPLAKKLATFGILAKSKISLKPYPLGEVAAAYYDPKDGSIVVFEDVKVENGDATYLVLHEAIHAITYSKLREDNQINKEFNKLRKKARILLGNKHAYYTKDLDEFMTGIFTNSQFILDLQDIPPISRTYANLWEEILDSILSVLGITKSDNLYQQAVAVASQIMEGDFAGMNFGGDILMEPVDQTSGVSYQMYGGMSQEEIVASENTIRDLAARMADRTGGTVRFEANRSDRYKGKIVGNTSYINLAYATLDTPIHEILGHPIIRAIKSRENKKFPASNSKLQELYPHIFTYNGGTQDEFEREFEQNLEKAKATFFMDFPEAADEYYRTDSPSILYQNLLKELEYGTGKEVLDRIKRDYKNLDVPAIKIVSVSYNDSEGYRTEKSWSFEGGMWKEFSEIGISPYEVDIYDRNLIKNILEGGNKTAYKVTWTSTSDTWEGSDTYYGDQLVSSLEEAKKIKEQLLESYNENIKITEVSPEITYTEKEKSYTLEEQQEEALVELLGLMTANKLDSVKDGKLISVLKRLLKEIKAFIKDLLKQREVEIDKLPDNMTLGDLSDLLAYSNSKIILPGNTVVYSTPDNQQFKTYAEASRHISELARNVRDINLDKVSLFKRLTKEELKKVETLEQEKIQKEKYFNSEEYRRDKSLELQKLNDELSDLKKEKVDFKSQEPYLDAEGQIKYGFQEFDYVRVESSYSRPANFGDTLWQREFGKDFEGYYIHGYNVGDSGVSTKVLKITEEEAKAIWEKEVARNPMWAFSGEALQNILRLQDKISSVNRDVNIKHEIWKIENEIEKTKTGDSLISKFIERNKEFEQSKEIIEKWKRINNIQYNPEEIYSRGQEFASVVGAYSSFDVDLMMQNLLSHIEDNEKAGGKFAISAFTKPVNKNIGHLEGGGGKIKFKIYPKSEDILWAANQDAYSGSVWDASEKVNKDKKSELLGVSYTKYPSLANLGAVTPNLASIVEERRGHHNELGIVLSGNNFRLEYDEDIPSTTKKIINSINAILDSRYGKLEKPSTAKNPIQPAQIPSTLKESISSVQKSVDNREKYLPNKFVSKGKDTGYAQDTWYFKKDGEWYIKRVPLGASFNTEVESYEINKMSDIGLGIEEIWATYVKANPKVVNEAGLKEKEYTEQALINTKIAVLKEASKSYPRGLIRSEVKPISWVPNNFSDFDDLPFQKVRGDSSETLFQLHNESTLPQTITPELKEKLLALAEKLGVRVEVLDDLLANRGVNGLANLSDFLIQLQSGREGALVEEVAHFFVAMMEGTPLYEEMAKLAPMTRMYKKVYDEYVKVYGKDHKRLKEEVMAKIISLYLTDPKAAEYWAGSPSLWQSILRWIKSLFGSLKKHKGLNAFRQTAEDMMNLNVKNIKRVNLHDRTVMYQLTEHFSRKFDTLDGKAIGDFDYVFINLNDTIFNYRDYTALEGEEKRDMIMGKNREELDKYYQNVELTSLGLELLEKIDFVRPKLIFHTRLEVTSALSARLELMYGIEPHQIVKVESWEEGPADSLNVTFPLLDKIRSIKQENPTARILTIDNKPTIGVEKDSVYIHYKGQSSYTPIAERISNHRRKEETLRFNSQIIKELTSLFEGAKKKDLLRDMLEAAKLVIDNKNSIERIERVLANMGEEELSEIFRDSEGNLNLPTTLAGKVKMLTRPDSELAKDLSRFLEFVGMLQGTTVFFEKLNQTNFQDIRDVTENPDSTNKEIDEALYQLNALNTMINKWNEWITQFNNLTEGERDITNIPAVLGDMKGQMDRAKANILRMSRDVVSKKVFPMFSAYNENKDFQIKSYQDTIAKIDSGEIKTKNPLESKRRLNELIREATANKVTPEKVAAALLGESKDINQATVIFKSLHNSGDPLIGGLALYLKRVELEADQASIRRAQLFNEDIVTYMKENNLSQKDIEELMVLEDTVVYDPKTETLVPKKSWALLNPFKDRHLYDIEVEKFNNSSKALKKAEEGGDPVLFAEAKKEHAEVKKNFENWKRENWHDYYTDEYYNRYESLLATEEDREVFEDAKEIQRLMWREIEKAQAELQHAMDSRDARGINSRILDEMRKLRALRNPYNPDGSEKTGRALQIANLLAKKSKIDYGDVENNIPGIFTFKSEVDKFKKEFTELVDSLKLPSGQKATLLSLMHSAPVVDETANFRELMVFAKKSAPLPIIQWLENNTNYRYSKDFYDTRKLLSEQISEKYDEIRKIKEELPMEEDAKISNIWQKLFRITSDLRDQNNVFDGTLSSPETQILVRDLEMEIEAIKRMAEQDDTSYSLDMTEDERKHFITTKKQLKALIEAFKNIQSKTVTDAYKDSFSDLIKKGPDSFDELMRDKGLPFIYDTDYKEYINNDIFKETLEENPNHPFVEWFNRNHFEVQKLVYNENTKVSDEVYEYSPTYIWRKITPSDDKQVEFIPGYKFTKREVKEEYLTKKIDWVTWNPITFRFLPKSNKFYNPEYTRVKNDPVKFGLLKRLTDFHLETQMQTAIPREAKLEFKVPYKKMEGFEGGNYAKSMYRQFTNKDNRFEEGEDNYGENQPPEKLTWKQRISSWFNGWADGSKVEEYTTPGQGMAAHSTKVIVPYSTWMEPDVVNKNLIYTLTAFAGTTSRSKELVQALPLFKLVDAALKDPTKLQGNGLKREGQKNRQLAVDFMLAHKFYGFNQHFEFGKGLDEGLKQVMKANSIGSLSDVTGWANNIKNNIQGRLNNFINTEFLDWSSSKSHAKAMAYHTSSLLHYLGETDKPLDKRGIDYHIITFFNPALEREAGKYATYGAKARYAQNNVGSYLSNLSEYSLGTNSLYAHLFHVKVTNGKDTKTLHEIFRFKDGLLTVEPGWKTLGGKDVDQEYLMRTKLAFASVQEYIQGKTTDKTLLATYTFGQALLYFKGWLIPMIRRRFDTKVRANYALGEDVQGYWISGLKMFYRMVSDFLREGTAYWPTYTPMEKNNFITMVREISTIVITSLLIAAIWGFDVDDEDKYEKLKDKSYASNLALLIALQAKSETESLSLFPLFTLESRIVPPVFTEATKFIKNPFLWMTVVDDAWKAINALRYLTGDDAFYDQNMPAYNIERGDSKFWHYIQKVTQFSDGIYLYNNPEGKIQITINNLKR